MGRLYSDVDDSWRVVIGISLMPSWTLTLTLVPRSHGSTVTKKSSAKIENFRMSLQLCIAEFWNSMSAHISSSSEEV